MDDPSSLGTYVTLVGRDGQRVMGDFPLLHLQKRWSRLPKGRM